MENVVITATCHVIITTVTIIAGFIPLLISGGSFWRPLAIAISGGISGSSIPALYFVPVVYLKIKQHDRRAKRRSHDPQTVAVQS
ncbi:MAG: efflux RND transporter permease subunit [Cyanobacteria bacterium P01_G01_bin.39]